MQLPSQGPEVLSQDEQYLLDCSYVFVSTRNVKKRIGRNAFSFCLRDLIKEVYRTALDDDCTAVKADAHEVQSIGASMPLRKNFAV